MSEFADYSEADVHYRVGLCAEAEYLLPCQPESDEPIRRFRGIYRMTWAGHEALEAMRRGRMPPDD